MKPGSSQRRAGFAIGSALSILLLAIPVSAHDALFPISGDDVTVRGEPAVSAGSEVFSFSSTDPNVLVGHDPAQAGTWVLVRGEGANAGRTPLIALDPTKWSDGVSGFVYDDLTGGAGGITDVTFDDGLLSIAGSGSNWSWSPAGPQDSVWVHFRIEEEWFCAEFPGGGASVNAAGDFQSEFAAAPVECPEVVCGNGVVEGTEACDDGNLVEDDGCTSECLVGECSAQEFGSTFEAIQAVVFEGPNYGPEPGDGSVGCSALGCHHPLTAASNGGLDLSAGNSYEALLGVDGFGAPSTSSEMLRVEPLDPQLSFLFRKLAAKIDPDLPEIPLPTDPNTEGDPMPRAPFFPLTSDHLEALRLWIRNGAPEDTVVEGTQELLGACLAEPDPQKIPVPDPPPAGTGIQLQQWRRTTTSPSSSPNGPRCRAPNASSSARGSARTTARSSVARTPTAGPGTSARVCARAERICSATTTATARPGMPVPAIL
jgi:cysteine-rich repeat protein